MSAWQSAKFKSIPLWIKRVLSRGSVSSDHHCSPKEMCSTSGLSEQLRGGGETSALLLPLIWFTACASHTCPQQLHPFIVLLQLVRGGIQAGRGSEDASFTQKLQLMVTMVTVHPEVDVVQVLGNDKRICLINKSLKHLQDWRVPALRKLAS